MDLKTAMTEIGEIPEDWVVTSLGEIGDFSTGKGVRRSESKSGSLPCVRYGEIYTHHHDIIRGFFSFISPEIAKTSKRLKTGDILFAATGETREEIGKSVAFIDEMDAYAGGGIVIFSPSSDDSAFLGYALNDARTRKQKIQFGQGDIVAQIRANALSSIIVGLPPRKSEQFAIAKLLNDMDEYICSLEKLIEKKHSIKQGVMQELFSGHRRLPGFKEKWVSKSLGSLGHSYGGLSGKTKNDFGVGENYYIPFCNVIENNFIDLSQLEKVHIEHNEKQNKVEQWDLIFNGSSETPEDVGLCATLGETGRTIYLNSFCIGFRLNEEERPSAMFFPFFFRSKIGREIFRSSAQGATRYNLSKANLRALVIRIPSSIKERQAIAEILKTLENEIIALRAQLNKARQVKQGMMQELLTGRVRLV